MSIQVADHVRDIPRSGIRDFFEIVQSMHDVISLGIGEPDFATPWHIREAAIYSLEEGILAIPPILVFRGSDGPSANMSPIISGSSTSRSAKCSFLWVCPKPSTWLFAPF